MAGDVQRFSRTWRVQHMLLVISVILLILSGLSLRYSHTWLGKAVIFLEGGFEARGALHRISAVVLLVTILYHGVYITMTREGRSELGALRPQWKDFKDFRDTLLYDMGRLPHRPRCGRYTYREKLQYWAFSLFLMIMTSSGVILWLHNYFIAHFPKWWVDVTFAVHGMTATLLFVFLVLWHLYIVHLSPGHFPWNGSFWHGKVSLDWLREFHAEEYEELIHGNGKDET